MSLTDKILETDLDKRISELKINKNNLDESILEFAELHYLLSKRYLKLLNSLNDLEIKLQERFAERYSFYKVDYDIQLSTQEIKMFIDNDKETIEIRKKIKDIKALLDYTEKNMKNIEQARWDCKNLIDYMKLKAGII